MGIIVFAGRRCLDGYSIVSKSPHQNSKAQPIGLTSTSRRFELYSLEQFPDLFIRFAGYPATAHGMRLFANNFGLPGTYAPEEGRALLSEAQSLQELLGQHHVMRRALDVFESGEPSRLVRELRTRHRSTTGHSREARLELRLGAEGRPELIIRPPTLIQAMWVQFLLHAAAATHLLRCEYCRVPFVVGTGTKRRKTRKYCSNRCKMAAFKSKQ